MSTAAAAALLWISLIPVAALLFHLFWKATVDRRDHDLLTEVISFLMFLMLCVLVVLRRW